jgi:hypothetical protein
MVYLDPPSHPTYNHSNPLLDTSTASTGNGHQEEDELEEEGPHRTLVLPAEDRNVPLIERGTALSQDTVMEPETTVS